MRKFVLAVTMACCVAVLGQTPVAAVDLVDVKRQHQRLVASVGKEKQTLRRARTLATVVRSATATSRQFENFAKTVAGLSEDSLKAIFLKLQAGDPKNTAKIHRELGKRAAQLRQLALAMAKAKRQAAAENAEKAREGDAAEEIADVVEDLIEEAEKVVDAIMGLFGL